MALEREALDVSRAKRESSNEDKVVHYKRAGSI